MKCDICGNDINSKNIGYVKRDGKSNIVKCSNCYIPKVKKRRRKEYGTVIV